eukprot:GHVU01099650.1.p2 GENE.GHVU01099650.1~~GHVU01099650.1.p2  ORF type:complete len:145 (+),score=11.64 GHVU01099650.1:111-545(+)
MRSPLATAATAAQRATKTTAEKTRSTIAPCLPGLLERPMTEARVKAYEDSVNGVFPDEFTTLHDLRHRYFSMHRVDWCRLEDSVDDPGCKQVRCDCKEWWHSKSCPHIYLMQHLKKEIDVDMLLRPVGAAARTSNAEPLGADTH